ncbi:hypothetical protein ACFPRL_30185 [Pseudoclavibacter helvolus]
MSAGLATTYVAWWPESGVLKVGRAVPSGTRLAELVEHGARILFAFRRTPAVWERAALSELRRVFEPAFVDNLDAWEHMPRGHGWSECVRVSARQIGRAIDLILKGTQPYADAEAKDGEAVVLPRSARDGGSDGDAVLRDGADGVGGRSRPRRGVASSDGSGDVAGRSGVGGASRGGDVAPRRVRVPAAVRGRGRPVAVPDRPGLAGHGGSPEPVVLPGGSIRERLRESCRESWLRRAREGAGRVRGRRAREREAPTFAVLFSPSLGDGTGLQTLRHGSFSQPPVDSPAARGSGQLSPRGGLR